MSVTGLDVRKFLSFPPSHKFWHFLQDGMFEHSGLVDTLSQGAERPIHSNRYSPDIWQWYHCEMTLKCHLKCHFSHLQSLILKFNNFHLFSLQTEHTHCVNLLTHPGDTS